MKAPLTWDGEYPIKVRDADGYTVFECLPSMEKHLPVLMAAPELLEALEGAYALAIGHAATYQFQHQLDDLHETHQEILNKARAAIAKATGEPQ